MPEPPDIHRMKQRQAEREQQERDLAEQTPQEEERQIHERRSDKASYLREKLEEQEREPDE
jgi:hypothetical protein